MTTATSEAVREVEVFRSQAGAIDKVLQLNLAGVTQEESLIQPHPGGNCLNWVAGHLLCIYNDTLPLLGQQPVMEKGALKRYARGTPPLEGPAEALELRDLLAGFEEATRRIGAGLATLTPEVLDRPAPHSPTNNPDETVRSLLTVVFFHQAYHTGQTGLLRRLAGKEGAIR
ncbi:MAG TPA: DinB family protein [Thermoanaerobaculia bacterium]|nr:DinB family protein [Thermoanaerobaculia bacterium]